VRHSYIVAALRCVLIVTANIAELVVIEALADLKVSRVRFVVKDLDLLDEAALI
jgi:hypothetical protein